MFVLLSKRLGRSMMRSKTRLVAVVAMVVVAVFAGVSFAAYAHTAVSYTHLTLPTKRIV